MINNPERSKQNAALDPDSKHPESRPVGPLTEDSFRTVAEIIGWQSKIQPDHVALHMGASKVTFAELVTLMERVAATLQYHELATGDTVAFYARNSLEYIVAFLGCTQVGIVPVPLTVGAAESTLESMLQDCSAKLMFTDRSGDDALRNCPSAASIPHISLDNAESPHYIYQWMRKYGTKANPVNIQPDQPFNIIYSSGTTGFPKGIVQPHAMRWAHVNRGSALGLNNSSVTLVPTPLYSNLTLVSVLSTLGLGGTIVLMQNFDALEFLKLAEAIRATHSLLVPIQYQRMLALPEFEKFDLSSFLVKISAGAPCSLELKNQLLARWPGELVDLFGMTEGGASCLLFARKYADKIHTLGKPTEISDIRILREDGTEADLGESGEIAGHSDAMMLGYHNQPEKTKEVEWYDSNGRRFIKTGDVGYFDQDGFLILKDRKKDMIISGGFNIYPSDLEAVLCQHEEVASAAVVGVPSNAWGETPVGFVELRCGAQSDAGQIKRWANDQLGKTQRISKLTIIDSIPRNAIDKPLKRVLKDMAISASSADAEPEQGN